MTDARPLSDQACSAGFGFVSHLVLSLLPALAGCASADQGCVPTMAELRIGMTKADAVSAWCYPSQAAKTESAVTVFDPASRSTKPGTMVRETWIYTLGPLAGSFLAFDENGRLVAVSEAHH